MARSYPLTPEQRLIAEGNNLSEQTIHYRVVRKGESADKAISYPSERGNGRVMNGVRITDEEVKIAEQNDVSLETLRYRMFHGWGLQRAITTPPRWSTRPKKRPVEKGDDLLLTVGRIKFMQRSDLQSPPPITKRMKVRLKNMGIAIEDVPEIVVDLEGLEEKV